MRGAPRQEPRAARDLPYMERAVSKERTDYLRDNIARKTVSRGAEEGRFVILRFGTLTFDGADGSSMTFS